MDISSGSGWPSSSLSNFAGHAFVFRGIPAASMEGLLQGLKYSNPDMQRFVMTLIGRAAKSKGAKKNWRRDQTLYWQGQPIKRDSDEYQALLDEAFLAMFTQNESARRALLATGDGILTHSIGKNKLRETVLTEREFVGRLMRIRSQLRGRR